MFVIASTNTLPSGKQYTTYFNGTGLSGLFLTFGPLDDRVMRFATRGGARNAVHRYGLKERGDISIVPED